MGEIFVIWFFLEEDEGHPGYVLGGRFELERNPDPVPELLGRNADDTATALLLTNQRVAAEAALEALQRDR